MALKMVGHLADRKANLTAVQKDFWWADKMEQTKVERRAARKVDRSALTKEWSLARCLGYQTADKKVAEMEKH